MRACVCVCVCVREREREREGGGGNTDTERITDRGPEWRSMSQTDELTQPFCVEAQTKTHKVSVCQGREVHGQAALRNNNTSFRWPACSSHTRRFREHSST